MSWDFGTFDLSDWKITLPVDQDYFADDGGDGDVTDDTAFEVKGDDFEGFEAEDFFYYDANEGAMIFTGLADGAKTSSGTKYARSELREMNGDANAAWTISEGGTLSATLKVTEMATEYNEEQAERIVIGQIHGQDDELTRLYYDSNGDLYFANEHTDSSAEHGPDNDNEREFYFENEAGERPNVSLGEDFSYVIDVTDNKLTVLIYADGQTYYPVPTDGIDPYEIVDYWQDDTFYFKAGVYMGTSAIEGHWREGEGQSTAAFYNIDVGHGDGEGLDAWLGDEIDNGGQGGTGGGEGETIVGTDAADTITGTDYDDTISGGKGGDNINGGSGDDVIRGNNGWDELRGGAGDDEVRGNKGNDLVKGGAGNDTLGGGSGNDEIWGEDGDDVMYAGLGTDWLKGGAGADTYVFIKVDGVDTVADFSKPNGDKIDVSAIMDNATGITGDPIADGFIILEQDGDDTQVYIDLDGANGSASAGHLATLENEEASGLDASDFLI